MEPNIEFEVENANQDRAVVVAESLDVVDVVNVNIKATSIGGDNEKYENKKPPNADQFQSTENEKPPLKDQQ